MMQIADMHVRREWTTEGKKEDRGLERDEREMKEGPGNSMHLPTQREQRDGDGGEKQRKGEEKERTEYVQLTNTHTHRSLKKIE